MLCNVTQIQALYQLITIISQSVNHIILFDSVGPVGYFNREHNYGLKFAIQAVSFPLPVFFLMRCRPAAYGCFIFPHDYTKPCRLVRTTTAVFVGA